MYEQLEALPFLGELVLLVAVDLEEFVRHFLGDVVGYLLHVLIALQVTAADVQRDVRRVDDAVEQSQILRYDVLDLIGHEDLVAVELDLVIVDVEVVLDLREVENTRQVERIIHIQMNMEQRFLELIGIELMIELLVVLFLEVLRVARPGGVGEVDDVGLVGFHLLAVFPLFLLAEDNLDRQELAVFLEESLNLRVLQVLLEVCADMEHDVRSALGLDGIFHLELGVALAAPMHGFGVLFVTLREDLHLVGDHECGVEAQAEVSDDGGGVVLVFVEELLRAGEGNLVDVFVHFLGSHTYTTVGDGERLLLFIYGDIHFGVAQVALEITDGRKRLEFLRCVNCIGNQLTKKDLVVAVKKLFDYGEDVVTCYPDITFCHNL